MTVTVIAVEIMTVLIVMVVKIVKVVTIEVIFLTASSSGLNLTIFDSFLVREKSSCHSLSNGVTAHNIKNMINSFILGKICDS